MTDGTKVFYSFFYTNRVLPDALDYGVALELVNVPGGSFLMGSPQDEVGRYATESPQRLVTIASFAMGKFPVTQAQYEAVMGKNPSRFQQNGANCPVERVTWDEAIAFCTRLSHLTGQTYRLPSEAEWEYACRANSITAFHTGKTLTTNQANYDGSFVYHSEAKGEFRQRPTTVGSFPPNAFGLFDMHGNVWEWCADRWHPNYRNAPTDGSAWSTDTATSYRVVRGGSWLNHPNECRSASRNRFSVDFRGETIGFRVVRE